MPFWANDWYMEVSQNQTHSFPRAETCLKCFRSTLIGMELQKAFLGSATVLAVTLAASGATAGTVTATAPASVLILAPVTVTATQGLAFGTVVRPGNAASNTVSLDADGRITISGDGDAAAGATAVSAAKFDVAGDPGIQYSTSQTLQFVQAGLSNVSVTAPVATSGAFGVIPPSGVQELRFGGAFQVSATTPAQAYTGSLTVTVNYN